MEYVVYNPDDEIDHFLFCAYKFALAPNGETSISDRDLPAAVRKHKANAQAVVEHLMKTLGDWGVTVLTGQPALDSALIKKAEEKHREKTLAWATKTWLDYGKRAKPYRDAGIEGLPVPDADEASAKKVLQDAGLLK